MTKKKSKWGMSRFLSIFFILVVSVGIVFLYAAYTSVSFVDEASADTSKDAVLSVSVWVPEKSNAIIDARGTSREFGFRGMIKKDLLSKEAFKVYVHDHRSGQTISTDKFTYTKNESGFAHQIILTKGRCLKSCSWHWQPTFTIKQHCRFVYENNSCSK
ncbi:MAG: hypothetical protein ACRBBN_08085 [Methyloligellaceae bacterium]